MTQRKVWSGRARWLGAGLATVGTVLVLIAAGLAISGLR